MKQFITLICAAAVAACVSSCATRLDSYSVPATLRGGTVSTWEPSRPSGQESALGLRCEPVDTVRVAFVGIGMRGSGAVRRWVHQDGVRITALCDKIQDNIDTCQNILSKAGLPSALEYCGEDAYKELCAREDIDLVYIATDWKYHVPVALEAMRCGHHAAIEVPSAMTLKECWELVDMAEKTRLHCICLENCCYDFFEATCLNMAREGLFGEVYHAEGAYIHNLDPYWGRYQDNWRILYNQVHRGDNYPTHGFGPICQVMGIHRSDIMTTLVAMDSAPFHALEAGRKHIDSSLEEFADGDHTISLIRTQKGKLMEVQHNVYAARPYSRMYQLTGTKGFANKYPQPGISLSKGAVDGIKIRNAEKFLSEEDLDSVLEMYKPQYIKDIENKAREVGGHGGMDFIMDYRLIECLRKGLPMDIDVYDLAEWCCVQELSRISIENGSVPVRLPDFTRGDWKR